MSKIEKAVAFATRTHAGSVRKGKDKLYILHPLEAMTIVMRYTDDEDVLAAAVLHDTVEDTSVTVERLEKAFGPRVAGLVAPVSEDKRKDCAAETTWLERKMETISHLKEASRDTKLICLGDKLSNLREMEEDYAEIDDELWERFNQKDKDMHAWYYREIYKILKEEFDESISPIELDEYAGIMDFVFGRPKRQSIFPEEYFKEEGSEE